MRISELLRQLNELQDTMGDVHVTLGVGVPGEHHHIIGAGGVLAQDNTSESFIYIGGYPDPIGFANEVEHYLKSLSETEEE